MVIDWCESNFLIFQCYASTNTNNLLSAIVCNFRTFVGHFVPSIWLRFGIKSSFRVLITKWILKSSSYFFLAKKRESALGLPILARQYDGSKVIFWIQLESYRKYFSSSRAIRETIFPFLLTLIYKNIENIWFLQYMIPTFKCRFRAPWTEKNLPQLRNRISPVLPRSRSCHLLWITFIRRWRDFLN